MSRCLLSLTVLLLRLSIFRELALFFGLPVPLLQVLVLSLHAPLVLALHVEPLPKLEVHLLTAEDFDSIYLDKQPLIIRGSTACPAGLEFATIPRYCNSNDKNVIPGNYVYTRANQQTSSSSNHTFWAGLREGNAQESTDLESFVQSMGGDANRDDELRFLFDLPMVEVCPTLPKQVRLPPQLVNAFASHFLYRHSDHHQKDDEEEEATKQLCTRLPFFNMYLAEGGFQTELHIDGMHTAFVASMCVGRKRWRVMTNKDFASVYDEIGLGGLQGNDGIWVMSSIQQSPPLDTWSTTNGKLESLNITIYEGILEPGEIIYIPAGAPHAAWTLDQSLMVASNDRTLQSLRDAVTFCEKREIRNLDDDTFAKSCQKFRDSLPIVERNLEQYGSSTKRNEETTLAKATGCETTFDLLDELEREDKGDDDSSNVRFALTPSNFRKELVKLKGQPLIVMKSQNASGWCLYLLGKWKQWAEGFDPPIRVGILHCLREDQCPYGHDPLYQQLLTHLQDKETPTFLCVTPPTKGIRGIDWWNQENVTLHFAGYHGFLSLDDLRIWASVHTGSRSNPTNDIYPLWWKMTLWLFHWTIAKMTFLVETLGPAPVGILAGLCILTMGLAGLFLLEYVSNLLLKTSKAILRTKNRSNATRDGKVKAI